MLQPLPGSAALGEGLARAEPLGEIGEDRVVVARLAIGRDHRMHRHQQRVVGVAADILALQRHRAGQHDIGVAGGRGPGELVDNKRVDTSEGLAQAVQVLMMMERVAAGPVDQLDLGIGPGLAVIAIGRTRVEQHVGDARDRDVVADRVPALREGRHRHGIVAPAVIGDGAKPVAIAAAGQADLAERRCEHHAHPDGLLAMAGALQGMGHDDECTLAVEALGQRDDLLGRQAGDGSSPVRILRLAIGLAQQIAFEDRPADRIAVEEGAVMQAIDHERVDQGHHQRGVAARLVGDPVGGGSGGQIAAQRAHQNEFATALLRPLHRAALDMAAGAAASDHAVLQRHAAEGEHDLAVIGDLLPGDVALHQVLVVADDMRHEDGGRARGIAVDRLHIAAGRGVQEAVDLALGVVEAPGTGPAIGAAEDCAGPEIVAHAAQFAGELVEHRRPRHRHIFVAAAAVVGTRPVFQPAAADHGLGDAGAVA